MQPVIADLAYYRHRFVRTLTGPIHQDGRRNTVSSQRQRWWIARQPAMRAVVVAVLAASCTFASATAASAKPSPTPSKSSSQTESPSDEGSSARPKPGESDRPAATSQPSAKPSASPKPNRNPGANGTNPDTVDDDYSKCAAEKNNNGSENTTAPAESDACRDEVDRAEDKSAAIAAAQQLLASAEADMARALPTYRAAKRKKQRLDAEFAALGPRIEAANRSLLQFARQSYMLGVDPNILTQVSSLESGDPLAFARAHSTIAHISADRVHELAQAKALVEQVTKDKEAADAEFTNSKAAFDLIRFNEAAAKFTLGLASGMPSAEAKDFFDSYPVQPCSFTTTTNTTQSCTQAQQYALKEVANPSKDWFYLCLNFVTIAYGAPQTIPRAIDMWTGLPPEAQHSPNTVAPPGALMFWAPNHVALSLGNNMVISTDILGKGRIWIAPMSLIQARWGMQYLGWTEPDFRNA